MNLEVCLLGGVYFSHRKAKTEQKANYNLFTNRNGISCKQQYCMRK